ncbi:(2Fe-2S) ferredoxin domain-containing protein [Neisseria sp. Ec49-e6-T10]|uniref:(2Fe-2S) ferredoxin domain-containing protein n=1 Tax=Neisseria sp. Ec49-e6-T10 TaxID=3140744 RepID=UPI003EBB6515
MSYFSHHVFVCTNKRANGDACCADFQVEDAFNLLKQKTKEMGIAGKGKVRISKAGCLGRCEYGPVLVIYPEAVWYTFVDEQDIHDIIDQHLVQGHVVERLLIPKD